MLRDFSEMSSSEVLLQLEISSSSSASLCAPYTLVITNTFLVSLVCLRPEFYKIKFAVLAILFASDTIAFLFGTYQHVDSITQARAEDEKDTGRVCLVYRLQTNFTALLFNAILLYVMSRRESKFVLPEKVPVVLSNVLCVLFNIIAWYIPSEINRLFLESLCIKVQGNWIHGEFWGLDLIFTLSVYRGIFIGLSFVSDYMNKKNYQEHDERQLSYISYL